MYFAYNTIKYVLLVHENVLNRKHENVLRIIQLNMYFTYNTIKYVLRIHENVLRIIPNNIIKQLKRYIGMD